MLNRSKTSLKAIMWLFLTLSYLNTISASVPWYHNYFHKLNGKYYTANCKLINIAQNIHGAALVAYYRMTHRKKNLNHALSSIHNKLAEHQSWLMALERDALIAIKNRYNIDDDLWSACLHDIECVKKSYTDGMQRSYHEVTHDPTITPHLLDILTTALLRNNINPHSVNLIMASDSQKNDARTNIMAQARSFIEIIKTDDHLTILQKYIPARIEIFPTLQNKSDIDKISFCAHEVQHLIQHHVITELILIEYLTYYYNIEATEFRQTKQYHTLASIQEAQAELLSALKDPEIAHNMKKMRLEDYYPNHLYEEHFYHLATIDMLWNVHGWLKWCQQDSITDMLYA